MNELDIFEIERFAVHDGPGIRTTVFFQGCPLRCEWCANPESQTAGKHIMRFSGKCTGCGRCAEVCGENAVIMVGGKADADRNKCISCGKCVEVCPNAAIKISGRKIDCDELYALVMRDKDYYAASGGGVTLSGGEALLQIDRLSPFMEKCTKSGISVAVETCGHIPVEKVQAAEKYVTLFLFDIKTLDSGKFHKFTGGDISVVFSSLEYIARTTPEKLVVRMPVIPGFNDGEVTAVMKYAVSKSAREIHLLPYHTLGIAKYKQLGREYLYPVTESLAPDQLSDYVKTGHELGITVKIGG